MACEESEVSVRKSRVNLQLRIHVQQITESAGPKSWRGWSMPIRPTFPRSLPHDWQNCSAMPPVCFQYGISMVLRYPSKHWLPNLTKLKKKAVSPKVLALGNLGVEDVQSRMPETSTGRLGDVLLIANGSISSMSMRAPISSLSFATRGEICEGVQFASDERVNYDFFLGINDF